MADTRDVTIDGRPARARVAVVIPCYGQAHFLGEAIESVCRQTHPVHDVLVVDDGSPDNVEAVTRRYPGIRYLRQANHGLGAARNTGLRNTHGDYVAFLDADDRLLPHAVETGVDRLHDWPDVACVAGRYRAIDAGGEIIPEPASYPAQAPGYEALLRGHSIPMGATVLYRRSCLDAAGPFDERLSACEDYDLYLRLASRFTIDVHDAVIAEYRRYGTGMTDDGLRMLRASQLVLRRQRLAASGRTTLRRAQAEGRRFWRRFYQRRAVEQLMSSWRGQTPWRRTAVDFAALARDVPSEALYLVIAAMRSGGTHVSR